jgi:hypothetical protein
VTEPTITCPACKTEIKLTESLAAPLLESTRLQYEQKLSQIEVDISKREFEMKVRQEALIKAQNSLQEQVEAKLKEEREKIVAEEARKARFALSLELEQKANALTELQEVLKERDIKLGEAQKAQAELIRKQRELDDAKREMELTIEKKVQDPLVLVREQATKEAGEAHKLNGAMQLTPTPTTYSMWIKKSFRHHDRYIPTIDPINHEYTCYPPSYVFSCWMPQ